LAYTPYSLEKIQGFITEAKKRQDHVFSIVDLETDDLIERCLLFDIIPVNRQAMLELAIGEKEDWETETGTHHW